MTLDRTSGISLVVTFVVHTALLLAFGKIHLMEKSTAQLPMLIEVTMEGTNAPKSTEDGVQTAGQIIAPKEEKKQETGLTPAAIAAWKENRRKEIIKELSRDRTGTHIGTSAKTLRKAQEGLAEGRGAGEWGKPGSSQGSLSMTGEIASRGYQETDFSILKGMITEETQLRLTLVVLPGGEVKSASLLETSGYPYVDQKAIELARKIGFDPLPANWKQVEQQGVLTIKLKL